MSESTSYERLKGLALLEGFNLTDGSVINAETKSYSSGIELVKSYFDTIINNIFLSTAEEFGLSKFLDTLDMEASSDINATKANIQNRYSEKYGTLSVNNFKNVYKSYFGELARYVISYGSILFRNVTFSVDVMKNTGKLIWNYLPASVLKTFDGSGVCWDTIESNNITFYTFDRFLCPFSILDTIQE